MNYIATKNKTIEITGATALIEDTAIETNSKIDGQNIICGNLIITLRDITLGNFFNPGPIPVVITPTSKHKIDGFSILREGDSKSIEVELLDPGEPPLIPARTKMVTISVRISDAGQKKGKSI